jgi:hypothetical protein
MNIPKQLKKELSFYLFFYETLKIKLYLGKGRGGPDEVYWRGGCWSGSHPLALYSVGSQTGPRIAALMKNKNRLSILSTIMGRLF